MSHSSNNYKETVLRMSGVNSKKCMGCGKCTGTCPAHSEMEYHPHQVVKMVNKNNIEPLLKSESIFYCLSCLACAERCPRGVEPAKLVEAVRLLKIRQQGENYMTADDIKDVLDDEIPQQALVSSFRKYSK